MKKQTRIQSTNIPRLSGTEFFVLGMLVDATKGLYGLEMVNMSDGLLSRGTIYVTLGRMKEKNFVQSKVKIIKSRRGGMPGVVYRPTDLGLQVYRSLKLLSDAMKSGPQRRTKRAKVSEKH